MVVGPVYQRFAQELGLDDSAFAGLTARTAELRALQGQLGSSLPRGQRGTPVAQAAQVVAKRFEPIRAKTEKGVARYSTERAPRASRRCGLHHLHGHVVDPIGPNGSRSAPHAPSRRRHGRRLVRMTGGARESSSITPGTKNWRTTPTGPSLSLTSFSASSWTGGWAGSVSS